MVLVCAEADYTPEKIAGGTRICSSACSAESCLHIGRHYLAGSLMVELTPLVNITPNLFLNLDDGSALAQWWCSGTWRRTGRFWARSMRRWAPEGTEYGGLETGVEDLNLR